MILHSTTLRTLAATVALAGTIAIAPLTARAAAGQDNIAPASAAGKTATPSNWTHDQLITSTVHDAWILSGKNEATFFDMVQDLAELSAKNRGITLPDDAATGRRMGEYIKRTAKADTDQLLYAVVDKAVVMASKTPVHKAGTPATK
jgi:hypothetical protein